MHFSSNDDGVNLGDGAVLVVGVGNCVMPEEQHRVHAERDAGRSPVNVEVSTLDMIPRHAAQQEQCLHFVSNDDGFHLGDGAVPCSQR